MIEQPPWKQIFEDFAKKHGFEFPNDYHLCLAGLAYVDLVANTKRIKDIEQNGIAGAKTLLIWTQKTLVRLEIDWNDYIEVKRMVSSCPRS